MTIFIATFFSHFGAIKYNRSLKEAGINGVLMPVPRKLSSSCGTCIKFEADKVPENNNEDVESLFIYKGHDIYIEVFSNL